MCASRTLHRSRTYAVRETVQPRHATLSGYLVTYVNDSSPSSVILRATLAISGGLAHAGAEWRRLLGWNSADLAGGSFIERVHPDDLDIVVHAIHLAYASNAPVPFTCRYAHKDGRYPWVHWQAAPQLGQLELTLSGTLA